MSTKYCRVLTLRALWQKQLLEGVSNTSDIYDERNVANKNFSCNSLGYRKLKNICSKTAKLIYKEEIVMDFQVSHSMQKLKHKEQKHKENT